MLGLISNRTLLQPKSLADALKMLRDEGPVVPRRADETRRVPFNAFYTGYRLTVRRPDELITAFEIPPVRGRQWFRKVGTRAAQSISKIVMAGVRDLAGGTPRVAIGSAAPT